MMWFLKTTSKRPHHAAGGKLVDYTYDPYGNTAADAASVANPFQDTGTFLIWKLNGFAP